MKNLLFIAALGVIGWAFIAGALYLLANPIMLLLVYILFWRR